MTRNFTLIFAALLLLPLFSLAQQPIRCYTNEVDAWNKVQNPQLESREDFEQWLQVKIKERDEEIKNGTRAANVVVTIPVVVHIIHNGDNVGTNENISQAQVQSQIEVLNEDFRKAFGTPGHNTHPSGADSEIEFCLALVDPNGNTLPEPGIDRVNMSSSSWSMNGVENSVKPGTFWDPTKYLNIWTVRFSSSLLGYAQFPNSSGLSGMNTNNGGASTDGVVVKYNSFGRIGNVSYPYDDGRTATHEIGHWLGLIHIWGDGGCSFDDFCNDTPKSDAANYGCPSGHSSCGTTDMIENYMDYTNDACMDIFTANQKSRMQTVLNNSPRRGSLTTSNVCSAAGSAPVATFNSDVTTGCPGMVVNFFDQSTNTPTSWNWTFPGGSPSSSTSQNPTVTYSTVGNYNVSLTATNGSGNNNNTSTNYIVVNTGASTVFYSEDFESSPVAWTVSNPDNDVTWAIYTVAGSVTGTKAAGIDLWDYSSVGQYDGLISPVLDFSGHSNVTLEFDHAHRRYSTNEQDSLSIYISTNGGSTFPNRVFARAENGSGNFATNTTTTNQFIPSASGDWCFSGAVGASCFTVNLSSFDGLSNIVLYFESYNDYGNNIFLDNIQLSGNCAATGGPPAPVADFSTNNTEGCEPVTISFQDLSLNSPTSWNWTFPGGNPSASTSQNPSVTYNSAGQYAVTLSVTNTGGTNSKTLNNYVTVFSTPNKPSINLSGGILSSSSATSYQWFINSFQLSGANSQDYLPTATGNYTVSVTDSNGCSNLSDPFSFNFVAFDRAIFQESISLYPNPSSANFNLAFSKELRVQRIELIDPIGKRLDGDFILSQKMGLIQLRIEALPAGIYQLRIITQNGIYAEPLVLQP